MDMLEQSLDLLVQELSLIEEYCDTLNNLYQKEKGKQEEIIKVKDRKQNELDLINNELEDVIAARVLLQEASIKGKEESRTITESIINKAFEFVFDEEYKFDIELKPQAGVTYAKFFTEVERDGHIVRRDPTESGGLGIVDVISLALRNAYVNIIDKENRAPICFDEPGKYVSKTFVSKLAEYLKHTSGYFNRQVFLITHNSHISNIGDKSFLVEIRNKNSFVVELNQ